MNTTCLKHGRVYVASAAKHRRQGEKQSARANERKRERVLTRGERCPKLTEVGELDLTVCL